MPTSHTGWLEMGQHTRQTLGPITGAKTLTLKGDAMNDKLLNDMCHKTEAD